MNVNKMLNIVNNDEEFLNFMEEYNIISNENSQLCSECQCYFKLRIRKRKYFNSFLLVCHKCKSEESLFNNTFFASKSEIGNSRIKLAPQAIFKLIFYYINGKTHKEMMSLTSIRSPTTIVAWCDSIRQEVHNYIDSEVLGGPGSIVQIDESLFRGRRKNNKGRYLLSDIVDSLPINPRRCNNYGDRLNGPWIFGMIEKGTRNVKMYYVENRSAEVLIPLIRKHIHFESIIWSDEWRAYSRLGEYFAAHQTINHSQNFIDPNTEVYTQLIECVWSHAKLAIMRNKKGTNLSKLQSHLSFFCFLYRYKYQDQLTKFFEILK